MHRRWTPLLFLLLACGRADPWPVCGNEAEVTEADYDTVKSGDFLVCEDLPEDGSDCPPAEEVDPDALFEASVGPAPMAGALRTDCGPETTRVDACCYVLEFE